jgi:hypothetical protein
MAMPIRIGPSTRLAAIFTAPLGSAITAWSYIWRITPIHRREVEGSLDDDGPGELPPGVEQDEVQALGDGHGPLFHRTYTGVVRGAGVSAAELIARLSEDPNRVVPLHLARFTKTSGEPWSMRVGDEFLVRMPGPWDGPVRAIELTPTSFRFATLEGHLEAGQIEWRAQDGDDGLVFQIDSRSRAGDRLSALLHDHLPMAKEIQLYMWTSVITRVARKSGGSLAGGISVETRVVDQAALP